MALEVSFRRRLCVWLSVAAYLLLLHVCCCTSGVAVAEAIKLINLLVGFGTVRRSDRLLLFDFPVTSTQSI